MATFARIINEIVLDPVTANGPRAAKALFGAAGENWVFVQVPDDTRHGDTDNGDGTFSRASQTVPEVLSKVAFMDLAYPLLGAGLAGVGRYGEILLQSKASASPLIVAAMERYTHASVFELENVATFLDILVADPGVDLTQEERDAVVNGWPENDRS